MAFSLNDHRSQAEVTRWIEALGVVDAPVPRKNVQESLSFFEKYMPRLDPAMAQNFLRATDLSKPVRAVPLKQGERLIAFRTAGESPFKLFFTRPGQSKHSSGLNPEGRGAVHFTVRAAVWALESYTTGAIDTWTPLAPGQPTTIAPRQHPKRGYMAQAGGLQLIIPDASQHLLVQST